MADGKPDRRLSIHLNCPHCHNPIEIVAANIDEEILCPSCGSSFHVDPDRTKPISCDKPISFGKFELIEMVGRGAFGAVYRARDTQLQRIVAVKVPRSGQLATEEDEDRFVREARNAAQLNHPSIVPVHEVGRSEAFPYIVSEFVEGVTLADALTDQRLGFRKSAQLVARVAEALEHAHSQGVVHRDLKPSNIMLTVDGTPRVMDFGLAKRDAGEITMTIEGQVLGTPAYMSPEQASGQAHHVDGRSDVYSLGVILFELLTGELPFRGNQRMLLQQVIHDEPRAPRSLNDRVPRDLETICLKSMAKEPGRRYQTAQALADDLQRYLAGQPIAARPAGHVERSWRWCRRNPVVASLSAAVAITLLSGTAVSTYFAVRATVERDRADAHASKATAERERAEEGFREARQTVDKYFTSVSESKLLNVPGLQPLRKELLESALAHYQKFIGRYGDDPKAQAELAKTYVRVGEITNSIASQEQSLAAFKKAIEIWERLVRENPTITHFQDRRARAYHSLGTVQSNTGRPAESESSYQKSLEIFEKLVRENPTNADYQDGLANAYLGLGTLQSNTDRNAEAEIGYKKAIETYDKLVREYPTVTTYQDGLALASNNLAGVQSDLGKSSAAEGSFQRAIEIHEKLVRDNPTVGGYQDGLALAYNNHGVAEGKWGRWPESEASYQKAFEIYKKLARENPTVTDYQHRLAGAYQNLGSAQYKTGRESEAEASYQSAIEIRETLVRENPTVGDFQKYLAYSYLGLGDIRAMSGKWQESAALFAKGAATENGTAYNLTNMALAQFAAGDEAGYRATCTELLARHGASAKGTEAYSIALACVVGEHAVEDTSGVVAVAKRAVASNPVCQVVLGAAQFRDGRTNEAIATLTAAMPLHSVAILVAPQMADAIRVSQLFGEVVLTVCYHDVQDKRAVQLHVEKVRALITTLETSPRQSHQAFSPWAVRFGIEIANRELARIESSATARTESNPK